jgi:hypothetical protein
MFKGVRDIFGIFRAVPNQGGMNATLAATGRGLLQTGHGD